MTNIGPSGLGPLAGPSVVTRLPRTPGVRLGSSRPLWENGLQSYSGRDEWWRMRWKWIPRGSRVQRGPLRGDIGRPHRYRGYRHEGHAHVRLAADGDVDEQWLRHIRGGPGGSRPVDGQDGNNSGTSGEKVPSGDSSAVSTSNSEAAGREQPNTKATPPPLPTSPTTATASVNPPPTPTPQEKPPPTPTPVFEPGFWLAAVILLVGLVAARRRGRSNDG